MADMITMNHEYKEWIKNVSQRYRQSQIKAAVSVNRELISFYWTLGKDISERENKWGAGFYNALSNDLRKALPEVKGFAPSNLRYIRRFYGLYSPIICPQAVGKLENGQSNQNRPQVEGKITEEELFSVPWGHHRAIMDRCKGDKQRAAFFVHKTIQNNWSRAVLMNFLDSDLYERQGKAISNFQYALPAEQSDLAQEMTKDPYNFDFLTIREDYNEAQLKDALMDNLTKFLMELGRGFSFVGREYPLPIEGTEERIDLLFYHLWLHCYVVIEVKVKAFAPADIGQTATYVAIADDLIRRKGDGKTIGLIICKSKNNVLAKYSVGTSNEPIGISEYELSHFLPTTEEIEQVLTDTESDDSSD